MNKYLVKIAAQQQNRDPSQISGKNLAVGAAATSVAAGAPSRLMGYHSVYHGTSKPIAAKIKAEGLDPNFGGTGAAQSHGGKAGERFVEQSKGHVHVTKDKGIAKFFAGFGGKDSTTGEILHREGEVLSAKIPHGIFDRMKTDTDVGPLKMMAAKGTEKIDSKFIRGAKDYGGRGQFLNKAHLKDYLSTSSGKNRFLRGVGLVATGVAGAALLGHELGKLRGPKPSSDS